jgi:predicted nucleotidyltransferase
MEAPAKEDRVYPLYRSGTAEAFYKEILHKLMEARLPFLVAGGYAVTAYTGQKRDPKDLDIFTTPGEFSRILSFLKDKDYPISIEDERWIGKVHCDEHYIDVIFSSSNGSVPVQSEWFKHVRQFDLFGMSVPMVSPTELIWSKALIRDRQRYDGADIANMILKQHREIDWHRLLSHMDAYWEVLLSMILDFRWIYPTERDRVPDWLLDALTLRLEQQRTLPLPQRRICRGRLFSRSDYRYAIDHWGYADIGGEENSRDE